ncbi:MAG: zf-HC2 domain-containing protein [bacterium]
MCPHEEKLTPWLLGDLPPDEHQALTLHLATCASCRSVKEELSHVLAPLRSGLEKDRNLRVAPLPTREASPRHTWHRLWSTPHEGLKRAAILALSFGTLFALISVVYQNAQHAPRDADTVTHITFMRNTDEAVPALAPVADLSNNGADHDALSEAVPRLEASTAPSASVSRPATPAPDRPEPPFRRLVNKPGAAPVKAAQAADAAPALSTLEKKTVAKRERSKPASAPAQRASPAEVTVRDFKLAAQPPVPTNAVPTNSVPTNFPPVSLVTNLPPSRR